MSQFGMQMQGARGTRSVSPDIYAVLAFVAVAAMIASGAIMFTAAQKVGKDGSPFGIQEAGSVSLNQ